MLQKEFTNLVLRTLSKKGIRFWQIIQQVEVLRSVHEKTARNTARAICEKFIATGDCQAEARGRPASKMQPFMAAYLEAMIFVNPFLYLEEMQGRLRADLNLLPHEVPSVPVICRTLHDLNLTKHKSTKVPQERFTPYNLVRRQAYIQWRTEKIQQNYFSEIRRPLTSSLMYELQVSAVLVTSFRV